MKYAVISLLLVFFACEESTQELYQIKQNIEGTWVFEGTEGGDTIFDELTISQAVVVDGVIECWIDRKLSDPMIPLGNSGVAFLEQKPEGVMITSKKHTIHGFTMLVTSNTLTLESVDPPGFNRVYNRLATKN